MLLTNQSILLLFPAHSHAFTGDVNNRVALKPHQVSWAGITFEAGAGTALFNSNKNYVSGSVIQYTDIYRAGYSTSWKTSHGLSLLQGSAPYLLGVDMIDCGGYGYGSAIRVEKLKGVFVARNVRVAKFADTQTYYPGYGIYASNNDNDSGLVVLESVKVEAGTYSHSLYLSSIDYASINHSFFASHLYLDSLSEAIIDGNDLRGRLILYYLGDGNRGKIDVTNNAISPAQPNQDAIYVYNLYASTRPSSISRNFVSNGRIYYYSSYSYYQSNITIEDNNITGSSIGGIYLRNYGSSYVQNNTITGCTSSSSSYPIVELYASYYLLHFVNNRILENQAFRIFSLSGSSDYSTRSYVFSGNEAFGNHGTDSLIYLSSYPWTSFTKNIFIHNTAPIVISVYMPNYVDEDTISLPLNHWGGFQSDVLDLRMTVRDAFILSSGPIVDFDPVLNGTSADR